jgi:hypothetical protein
MLPSDYGFILLRHVNSIVTNDYWKRSYTQLRKFYDHPILIIDDHSDPHYLVEDIDLVNCEVVHSTFQKGAGEILPYYYLHKLRPFHVAIILHDSVFIHECIPFELKEWEPIRFIWTIPHHWDADALPAVEEITAGMPHRSRLLEKYPSKEWWGSFGGMSIIRLSFLDQMEKDHHILHQISLCKTREHRSGWERLLGLLAHEYVPYGMEFAQFRNINHYLKMGITYNEYLTKQYDIFPIVKVWTGR